MKTKIIIGIIVLAIIVLIVVFYKPVPKEAIKIGAILSLTGKAASMGVDVQNAINLAVEKVDKEKKIIEVFYEDDKCDPKEGVSAYQALRLKGVNVIIGAVCSPSTLAIAPLAEQDKVIIITPASSADTISQAGDFIFRNHIFTSKKWGKLGEFASKKFKSVATLYDQSNDAFILGEKAFVDEFLKGDGKIVERQGYQKDATDFRTELTKIKTKNPEAIAVVAGLMPQSALIIKQMREIGLTSQILAEDALATDKVCLEAVGDLAEGIIFSGTEFSRETNPEFWDLYTQRFGKNPNIYAAQGYDSLMILDQIIFNKKCGTDTNCIKNELYKIKDYPGAAGKTTFDENGDAIKPITIKIIKNGQFVPYTE